jgi:hypothetical protein
MAMALWTDMESALASVEPKGLLFAETLDHNLTIGYSTVINIR